MQQRRKEARTGPYSLWELDRHITMVAGATGAIGGGLVSLFADGNVFGTAFLGFALSIPTWLILRHVIRGPTFLMAFLAGLVSPLLGALLGLGYPLLYLVEPWFVTFPIGILTAFLIRPAVERYHREKASFRCWTCNYDLRADTTGVCPECGEQIPGHRLCDIRAQKIDPERD